MNFSGYQLIQTDDLAIEQSEIFVYEHEKTGAKIYYMKNEDPNKVFGICFPTLPIGSTGNMHIMEHSVLNGSRKYKTKEPFMDLLKSSLQTFLNAGTYPDKTVYPVASRNDADFANLMDLYLDAVFYPAVLNDERIFRQEGWRHEIFSPEKEIHYAGVVYNEMRGAMSDPLQQVAQQINEDLFAGTIYAQNSGGDPYEIPKLDFQTFREYHAKFYHPSNAIFFLYGNIQEEETFTRLSSYLDDFEHQEIHAVPQSAKRFEAPKETQHVFSVAEGEETEGKSYLSLSWLVDEARTDPDRYLPMLLGGVLVDSERSPIRHRLLEELGADNVFANEDDMKDVGFRIIAQHVDPSKKEEFVRIILEGLQDIVEKGIDPDIEESILNRVEFGLREKFGIATKGILFFTLLVGEASYGLDPLPIFHYDEQLLKIREELRNGALERYIRTHLLENSHRVLSVHIPEPGHNAARDEKVREELAAYKDSLSSEELAELIAKNEALLARQNAEDSPEEKATIPSLSRDELPKTIPVVPRELRQEGEDVVLFHDLPTAGIHYLNLVFDFSSFSVEEAPYVMLVSSLLGHLDTQHYTYQDYEIAESMSTGGITVSPKVLAIDGTEEFCRTVTVSTKVLGEAHTAEAFRLIDEQLFHTKWEDSRRIQELIRMDYTGMLMSVAQSGHLFSAERAQSHLTPTAAFRQYLSGIPYLRFLGRLTKEFTEEDRERLEDVANRLFSASHRVIHVTSSGAQGRAFLEQAVSYVQGIPTKDFEKAEFQFTPDQTSEAFITTTDVQYNAVAVPYVMESGQDGRRNVLTNILTNSLLYNEIRAKGGAYGQMASISREGNLMMTSFRDPNVRRTYDVYRQMGDAVSQLDLDPSDVERFVVGAVGSFDRAMTEAEKGEQDLYLYLQHRDPSEASKRLKEILSTNLDFLRSEGAHITRAMKQTVRVTIGSPEAIEADKSLFDTVERL